MAARLPAASGSIGGLQYEFEEVFDVDSSDSKTPTLWDDVLGQPEVVSYFRQAVTAGEVSHAYLLLGPEGVGKETVAFTLAAALNCDKGGCGGCSTCRRIRRQVHPDVQRIGPEGNFIHLDQVKALRQRVYLRPLEGQRRVYIVDEAESLTVPAANAFLKILEEPPLDVVFILITDNEDLLLPTVVSRCQEIRFRAVSQAELRDYLRDRCNLSLEEASLISRISGGIPGRATAIASSEVALKKRRLALEILETLAVVDAFEVFEAAERLMAEIRHPGETLEQEQEKELSLALEQVAPGQASSVKKRLKASHKRELNRRELEGLVEVLRTLASWYRDVLVLKESSREDIVFNLDHVERAGQAAKEWSSEALMEALQLVNEMKKLLRFNVNRELLLEVTLFGLQEVAADASGSRSSL